MGLEKVGLPPKPSEKGKHWTPDATNCEGCQAAFSLWNRKHHCRRCGGLFCNNCTLNRQVLRGQGDTPVRICEPCKKIEEATKFELRYGKSKTPRGASRASSKDESTDALLKQLLLQPGGKSQDGELDLDSVLASAVNTDSDEQELGSPSQVEQDVEKSGPTKLGGQNLDETFGRINGQEKDAVSPSKLHEQSQEEKQKYSVLKKQGKDAEAMKAFKRAKELERQAEALEKEIKQRRRASVGPNSPLGQHSKTSSNKEEPDSQNTDPSLLSRRQSDPGENLRKRRASSRDQDKEKVSTSERDDFLQDLKALGWTDKEIREADKNPAAKSEEQLLAELSAEARPKSNRAPSSAAPGADGAMSMQILAHKRQALALKREGRLVEAKDELRKAKLLEKQLEEMVLLGEAEGDDDASDDDELQALIRGLEREEKLKGNTGKGGGSQSIPEDIGSLPSFVGDDDDADVEVDDDDLHDPEMVAALRAMGWEEEAAGLEWTSKSQLKTSTTSQPAVATVKEQILARKRKALALKREGNIAEARAELGEAKKLEGQLEKLEDADKVPSVLQAPQPHFDVGDDKIEDADEKVEVTDEDMRDPEMMAALRAMGFAEDEPTSVQDDIRAVTKPNSLEKAKLNQEILALKRQALALKREGRVAEAREELRHAKVLEQQLQDLQAVFQRQEEAPAMIKESRAIRRGAQALPVLSGVPKFDDEGEEDVEVLNTDVIDPDIARALAAVGWQDDPEDKFKDTPVSISKNKESSSRLPLMADAVLATESVADEQLQRVETKVAEPAASAVRSPYVPTTSNPVLSTKTKSQLQQELLGRKRRALTLKREGKSEEARVELQEAKVIEHQLAELEKGLAPDTPAVGAKPQPAPVQPFKQDTGITRPLYLDDEPVDEVEVTEDDMQDPELLAALAGVGWQGDVEVTAPPRSTPVMEKTPTTVVSHVVKPAPQAVQKDSAGAKSKSLNARAQTRKIGDKTQNLLEFDWGDPLWHAKESDKDISTKGGHKQKIVSSSQMDNEENNFDGEYGEIGQTMDLVPPLLDHGCPKVPAATPKQHHFWQSGFMDLLSGDQYNASGNEEQTKIKEIESKKSRAQNQSSTRNEDDIEDVFDPKTLAALRSLGMAPSEAASERVMSRSKGASQGKESSLRAALPPQSQVTSKVAERPAPSQSSTRPATVSISEAKLSVQPATSSVLQEILALKRKALALKREGKAGEARDELRKAKLLERQMDPQGSPAVSTSTTAPPATGRGSISALSKVEEVSASTAVTPSRLEPMTMVKSSPPLKDPAHKEQMQQQLRQTKDRMKLQQESLAHKRKAMNLRREGKSDEADSEYELAKNLEKQMEDLDPMHGKEDLGDVTGVDDILDPQLLAALKEVGFKEGELAGASGPVGVVGHPRGDAGSSSKSSLGGIAMASKPTGRALEAEKIMLQEQIRGEKLKAVQLKRAGKQTEALEKLRGAKHLEKRLLALTS